MKSEAFSISEQTDTKPVLLRSLKDWEEIFNAMTDIITIHDKEFNIIYANTSAKKVLGLPNMELNKVIKCFSFYHGTECPPSGCPSCDCVKSGKAAVFELFEPHLGRNIEIRAMARFDKKNQIIGVIHICRDITERKRSEEQLKSSREKLRNLTAHLNLVREEERKHIAREIHDELAQALTALKIDLFWMDKRLSEDQLELQQKITSMSDLIDMTIKSVRRISSELRPGLLDDLGLQAAMEWQAKEFQSRTGIKCEIDFRTDDLNLEQDRATAIFRIFQETLTNVVRHAGATKVKVKLKEMKDCLSMEVSDNGRGITDEQIANPKSFGLMGIQERVHLLGGIIKIKGVRGKKTVVSLDIPLNWKNDCLDSPEETEKKKNV